MRQSVTPGPPGAGTTWGSVDGERMSVSNLGLGSELGVGSAPRSAVSGRACGDARQSPTSEAEHGEAAFHVKHPRHRRRCARPGGQWVRSNGPSRAVWPGARASHRWRQQWRTRHDLHLPRLPCLRIGRQAGGGRGSPWSGGPRVGRPAAAGDPHRPPGVGCVGEGPVSYRGAGDSAAVCGGAGTGGALPSPTGQCFT